MLGSLRARLILLVGVAFLPMLAITARDVVQERDVILQRAMQDAASRVDAALVAQHELIADGRRYLGAVALLAPVSQGDAESCRRTVDRVRDLLDEGWSFARHDATGATDCAADVDGSQIEMVSVPRPHVASTATGAADMRVGGYGRDVMRNEPVIMLLRALHDSSGRVSAELAITMHMAWIRPLVQQVTRDPDAVVAITDASRHLIARYPFAGNVSGVRAPVTAAFDSMLAVRNGMAEGAGIDGVQRLWIFRQLPSPEGIPVFLSVGVPFAPLVAAANQAIARSSVVLALTVLLVLAAAWWSSERFVLRDVRALLGATQRLAQGDLTARSGLRERRGELGRLSDAFDSMASQLEHRQERLAHAQKMESVGQLAGGVAHDFNNLLTAIVANTEVARDSIDPAHPAHADLLQVLHAARRSGQLTRQLLAFARQHTFATRVLTLDRLLGNVSSLLERLIGEHIDLRVSCDPELDATRVDPTQIEQAIINLAVNARDAMPQGGTLSLSVRNLRIRPGGGTEDTDPPGRWVAITVTDTGVGMPPEVLRHVFEPFFTTKPVGRGTGLGLAMVYGTARQHGGHVHVTSGVGKGTSVRMLLPVDQQGELTNETPAFGTSLAGTGRGDETILLVEDEAAVRAVGARLLRARGYAVIEAEDGAAALEIVASSALAQVDLVLTDLVMPRVGGAELVAGLRARRPDLPVLLVSGYSETGIPSGLLEAPATAFLEKPFNAQALLGAVRSLLDDDSRIARQAAPGLVTT